MLNILPNYAEKIRVGFGRCVKEFFFFFSKLYSISFINPDNDTRTSLVKIIVYN